MKNAVAAGILTLVLIAGALEASAAEKEGGFFNFGKKKEKATEKSAPAAPAAAALEKTAPAESAKEAPRDRTGENTLALVNRMANNRSMTDAEKKDLTEAMLKKFPASADLRSAAYEKQVLFFEQVSNDPNMKVAEKKAAIGKYSAEAVAVPAPVQTQEVQPMVLEAKPVTQEPLLTEVETELVEDEMLLEADVEEKSSFSSGNFAKKKSS